VLRPIERLIYKLTRVDETREMRWTEYAMSMLLFSAVTMLVLYLIQRLQGHLPFNPQHFAASIPRQQHGRLCRFGIQYRGVIHHQHQLAELRARSNHELPDQMAGLAYHNFVSAAVGIALAIAFIRGIARREMKTIGNFWVDMTRATLWVLLPACIVGALVLVASGVPQTFGLMTPRSWLRSKVLKLTRRTPTATW